MALYFLTTFLTNNYKNTTEVEAAFSRCYAEQTHNTAQQLVSTCSRNQPHPSSKMGTSVSRIDCCRTTPFLTRLCNCRPNLVKG